MTTPDLTPTTRSALDKALDKGGIVHDFLTDAERDALTILRDACPEQPRLEDGIYEVSDEDGHCDLWYVRDGRYAFHRLSDGTLDDGGHPLPADVSTWRRIDGPPTVTPEQVEAAAREAWDYSAAEWTQAPETRKDAYRARARKILAAAGIEASDV